MLSLPESKGARRRLRALAAIPWVAGVYFVTVGPLAMTWPAPWKFAAGLVAAAFAVATVAVWARE